MHVSIMANSEPYLDQFELFEAACQLQTWESLHKNAHHLYRGMCGGLLLRLG